MNWTLIGIIALVVVLIVGPFATLRAVSHYRQRRVDGAAGGDKPPTEAESKAASDAENEDDKPSGFW